MFRSPVTATAALLLAAALPALPAQSATAFASGIYVFGDSLVDAGNVFLATGGASPNPAQGYFQGRFTNGLNYPDYFNRTLFGTLTAPSGAGGNNYAVGGARAGGPADFGGGFVVPSLGAQIAQYVADSGGVGDDFGVYIINVGGNDLFALGSGQTQGLDPAAYAQLVVANIVDAVLTLDNLRVGRIVVTGIPNPGPVGAGVEALLLAGLESIEPILSSSVSHFSYLDFYGRFLADPTAYGFPADVNTTTPCIAVQPVIDGSIDCSGYFSFDGIHFTAGVQAALARDIGRVAGLAVPEPASWALFIAGFGLVGSALRRRRPVVA